MPKPCKHPGTDRECVEPVDPDSISGFCSEHQREFHRSPEWREATKDSVVAFAAQADLVTALRKAVRPYAEKWVRRLRSEMDQEDAGS